MLKKKKLIKEDRYDNASIKDLRKDYPDKIKNLEEILLNYIGQNDRKALIRKFPDKWKCLTRKLAYRYEHFNSLGDYREPVDNIKKEDFLSKLKEMSWW